MALRKTTGHKVVFSTSNGPTPLEIPLVLQEQDLWCWAACAKMVVKYVKDEIKEQCALANVLLGETFCCTHTALCDKPCDISDIKTLYDRLEIHCHLHHTRILFSELDTEIQAEQPVEICFRNGSVRHVVIVYDSFTNAAGQYACLNDPNAAYSGGCVTYDSLIDAYGAGTWEYTWTEIRE